MNLPPPTGPGPYPGPHNWHSYAPRPARLEFGRLLSESFRILWSGLGRFLLLGALPAVITYGAFFILLWLTLSPVLVSLASQNAIQLIWPIGLGAGLIVLVSSLAHAQVGAIIAWQADQLAEGRPASLGAALAATRTIVPRLLVIYLVLVAAGVLTITAFFAAFLPLMWGAFLGDEAAAVSLLGLVMLFGLAGLAVSVASIILQVKFFLFLPVAAIEGTPAVTSLRRSWQLTKGVFWLLLAAILVVGIALNVVGGVAGQFTMLPLAALDEQSIGGLGDVAAIMLATMGLSFVVSAALSAFSMPLFTIMSTVAYRHQVRPGAASAPAPEPQWGTPTQQWGPPTQWGAPNPQSGWYTAPGHWQPGPQQPGPSQPGPQQPWPPSEPR